MYKRQGLLENRDLQIKQKEAEKENTVLQKQSIFFKEQSVPLIEQNITWKEKEKKYQESVCLLESMEQGVMEKIRKDSLALNLELLQKKAVGADTPKNIKRFYLCSSVDASGFYQAEFYLADYLTGEFYDLNQNVPTVKIASSSDKVEEAEYQIWTGDLDGDEREDILVIWMTKKNYLSRGFYIWLQRDREFLPVNREYCGNYMEKGESDFSQQIQRLEEQFWSEQALREQEIGGIAEWIRNELFLDK